MASLLKAEVKIGTAHEIGSTIEDMMEEARRNELRYEGAIAVLKQAIMDVAGLSAHVEKDIEEGKIKLDDFEDLAKIEIALKRWVGRAVGSLEGLKGKSSISKISSAGQVSAYKKAMDVPGKVISEEKRKVQALLDAIEAVKTAGEDEDVKFIGTRPEARPTGMHPGDPLAERRVEAAAEKAAKVTKKKATKKVRVKKATTKRVRRSKGSRSKSKGDGSNS